MTATLDRTVSIGKRLVGSYSRPNKFITWYCDKRNLTGAWLTAAWCAMFASFVLKSAGAKGAGEFAYCPSWVKHFKAEKRWGTEPRVGAVAFFDWDRDGLADHVGIVTDVGAKVRVLEGNTRVGTARNRVAIQSRSKHLFMGFGYPDYGQASARTYTVRKGDSLSRIAKAHGTTWERLYELNKRAIGAKPELIKVGMELQLP